MYTIRRCKICKKPIHVHKKETAQVFKNRCEHIPDKEKFTSKDIDLYLFGMIE